MHALLPMGPETRDFTEMVASSKRSSLPPVRLPEPRQGESASQAHGGQWSVSMVGVVLSNQSSRVLTEETASIAQRIPDTVGSTLDSTDDG